MIEPTRTDSTELVVRKGVEHERNYLLNPVHADFKRIKLSLPQPFRLGLRLVT